MKYSKDKFKVNTRFQWDSQNKKRVQVVCTIPFAKESQNYWFTLKDANWKDMFAVCFKIIDDNLLSGSSIKL